VLERHNSDLHPQQAMVWAVHYHGMASNYWPFLQAEKALRRRIQGWCNTNGNLFHAVGFAETPFPDRRGTPRQGRLAPATRGVIRLNSKLCEGLDGVEAYEHSHSLSLSHSRIWNYLTCFFRSMAFNL